MLGGTARHEAPQEGKGPEQEVGTPEVGVADPGLPVSCSLFHGLHIG